LIVTIPTPVPGLIVRYAYLWADEHEVGLVEGVKDRPTAVILAHKSEDERTIVVTLPITHSPPSTTTVAIEIPQETKRRLGLDDDRSWVIVDEANVFLWPGPDLRPARGPGSSHFAFGLLPAKFTMTIRDAFVKQVKLGKARRIPRTE
jgi:hypothetical protein